MAHLMWVGPQMAINSHAFHLLKYTKKLRARKERSEKRGVRDFSKKSMKNISVVFF
jgi:hypothetical protein